MAQNDERLVAAFGDRVGNVLDGLPFARLAGEQEVHVGYFERANFTMEAGRAGTKRDALHFHVAIGNDAHHVNSKFLLKFIGKSADRRFGNREEIRIRGVLIFLPAERMDFSRENSITRVAVPVIVESPDD